MKKTESSISHFRYRFIMQFVTAFTLVDFVNELQEVIDKKRE